MRKSILAFCVVLLLGFSAAASATGEKEPCSHPVFVTHACLDTVVTDGQDGQDGQDGSDGQDGKDGRDGQDGQDGIDGIDGQDGRDGIDGIDGVVPSDWINQLDNFRRYSMALDAAQAYLPQNKNSRFTLGASQGMHQLGVGLGYAYVDQDDDNRLAFTIALGFSGDHVAARASVGFEF